MIKCYADNSVDQMLKGKAYARAVRAHQLLQLALGNIVFKEIENDTDEFQDLKEDYRIKDFDIKKKTKTCI